jgi:holo-[acyl-carrier protein] synthase
MILGVGIDIVEVARIRAAWKEHAERFLHRFLLEGEIRYCLSHADPAPAIAARFAAKEAVSKAFGTGIGGEIGWHDIEIVRGESGRPDVVLHEAGARLLAERGARRIHVSLSHAREHATAVAILEA